MEMKLKTEMEMKLKTEIEMEIEMEMEIGSFQEKNRIYVETNIT